MAKVQDLMADNTNLVVGAFERKHVKFLGLLQSASQAIKVFITGDDRSGFHGTVAVCFFQKVVENGALQNKVAIPIFLHSSHFAQDETARKYYGMSRADQLNLPMDASSVGWLSQYLVRGRRKFELDNPRELYSFLNKAVHRYHSDDHIILDKPEAALGGDKITRSWGGAAELVSHMVFPIALQRPVVGSTKSEYECDLLAAFAVDSAIDLKADSDVKKRLGRCLRIVEALIVSAYRAYYASFSLGVTLRSALRQGGGWDWPVCLSAGYFEKLTHELEGSRQGEDYLSEEEVYVGSESGTTEELTGEESFLGRDEKLIVFYCDGNGVKNINDRFGHEYGNLVILLYASALSGAARELRSMRDEVTDALVIRNGGDEFCVAVKCKVSAETIIVDSIVDDFCSKIRSHMNSEIVKLVDALGNMLKKEHFNSSDVTKQVGIAIGWTVARSCSDFGEAHQVSERYMYACKAAMKFYGEMQERKKGGSASELSRGGDGDSGGSSGVRVSCFGEYQVAEIAKAISAVLFPKTAGGVGA